MISATSAEEKDRVLKDIREKGVQFVDLEFVDMLGTPKMCEITASMAEHILSEGLWFDG